MSQSFDNDLSKDVTSKKDCGSSNNNNKNNCFTIPKDEKEKIKSQTFNKKIHHE